MKIYNYHAITKEYINESVADIDPLETKKQNKEVYLVPAFATEIKPPIIGINEVAVFENNKWVIKTDFRGETYYDKITRQPVIIDFIGEAPESLQKNEPEKSIEEIKQEQIAKIKQVHINFMNSSITIQGYNFIITDDYLAQLDRDIKNAEAVGLVSASSRDIDNNYFNIPIADMKELYLTLWIIQKLSFLKKWNLEKYVKNLTNPEEIKNFIPVIEVNIDEVQYLLSLTSEERNNFVDSQFNQIIG